MADLKHLTPDWPVISVRLDEALAMAPEARAPWLAALSDSQAIKDTLHQLLSDPALAETADFAGTLPKLTLGPSELLHPPPPGDAPVSVDTVAGTLVGPYQLLRELGVGGMGQVWLAQRVDGGLKRPVALKLPRISWDSGLAERLQRERDILVSLDHPHIARIYDAGVDQHGRPYLALEYVEGEPIDAYCKTQGLGITQRLQLILQVARAVAHAHARLVVHRDLKPANILVTAQGQVRLLDFGIAKLMQGELTHETALTRQAGRALTLDYASPEQIRGEPIGTASDVYSLGVVAYELLAEAKPYQLKRQSAAALEEAIALVDVRLASVATANTDDARLLKGDLDAILNRALKKTVAQRYPTVEAFAQDIERHLGHQPVLAQPDSWGYRAAKFWRRNQLAVAASVAVSVSLIAGLSVATWQARLAYAQADRAEQVKGFVLSIFDDADGDSEAGVSRSAADLLKLARTRVNSETGGRPEVAVELMTAIGQSMVGQGLTAEAAALLGEAVELSTRQLGPKHTLTTAAQLMLGEAQAEMGQNKPAIATLLPAIESARQAGDMRTLNAALRWMATAQSNLGHVNESLGFARQAVETLSARPISGKPITARTSMLTYQQLLQALDATNQPGAVAAARLALAAAREVYGDKVSTPVLTIRTLLATAQVRAGEVKEGLSELDDLVKATQELLGPRHPRLSKLAYLAGSAKLDAGDVPGAITAFQISQGIEDLRQGPDSAFDRGMIRFFLAGAYAAARQPGVALPLLDEAIALISAGGGPTSPRTLRARSLRAGQLAEAGKLAESELAFAALGGTPWSDWDLAAHQGRLATLRGLQGRHAEALALAQVRQQFISQGRNKEAQARALAGLGSAQLALGDTGPALASLQQAEALFTQLQPGMSPDHALTLMALGRARLQAGDRPLALASLTRADRFWQAFDPTNRHADRAKRWLAEAMATRPVRSDMLFAR